MAANCGIYNNCRWALMLWGIALVILGGVAIYISTLTTLVSVILLGSLILIGGIFVIVDSGRFWRGTWGGFLTHLFIGILYLVVGSMLIVNPLNGAISLTLLLAIFYIMLGLFRMGGALAFGLPKKGWIFIGGLIALLLGILILIHWPTSSLFIIGLFIGIDLLFTGFSYIFAAASPMAVTLEE